LAKFGYGRFWLNGKIREAHRVSWELFHGEIPTGLCVLHRCDNPPCVNPAHLFLGTRVDNNRDMFIKGRHARGAANGHYTKPEATRRRAQHPRAKVSEADVAAIRAARAEGRRVKDIAAGYKLDRSQVSRISRGVSWKE